MLISLRSSSSGTYVSVSAAYMTDIRLPETPSERPRSASCKFSRCRALRLFLFLVCVPRWIIVTSPTPLSSTALLSPRSVYAVIGRGILVRVGSDRCSDVLRVVDRTHRRCGNSTKESERPRNTARIESSLAILVTPFVRRWLLPPLGPSFDFPSWARSFWQ
jgi:hypothetical protein